MSDVPTRAVAVRDPEHDKDDSSPTATIAPATTYRPARLRSSRLAVAGLIALLVLPLAVAAVALRSPRWYPVLDLAMTELRVRDVGGSHTPLIGLPGRIGDFPEQGSHPGPLSFYALAPVYKLLGSSSWALLVSALALNATALGASVAIAYRRGGVRAAVFATAVLALLARGYGISTVSEPWNPYMPLLWWAVVLLSVASVVAGDVKLLPVAVVAASMAAQTHVPYLGLCLGMGALAVAALALRWRAADRLERRTIARWTAASVALAALLWTPPVVDQLTRDPGNLAMLWDHFASPPEAPVGLRRAVDLLLYHLDVVSFARSHPGATGSLVQASSDPAGSVLPGLTVLAVWVASVAAAWRLRHRAILRVDAVVAAGLVLALSSMSRIFGKVWYYLMLWAWGVSALLVVAVLWTAAMLVSRALDVERRERAGRVAVAAALVVALASTAVFTRDAARAEEPAHRLSITLAGVVPPTAAALEDGVGAATGRGGRYVVSWNDGFYIGSQGYGLVLELERLGFEAGATDPWRVPITHHRVIDPEEATARVHYATGKFIDQWRAVPRAVEVAYADPRTPAQREEFERLRAGVIADLRAAGRDDLIEPVDGNLFGATLDPDVSPSIRTRMERMLHLGLPGAVFIAPPDTPVW